MLLLHCGSWLRNLLFKFFSIGEAFVPMSIEDAENRLSEKHTDLKSSSICENTIVSQETDLQIIIPVYNTERFLRKCIDSVLNQKTKYSFKVVVVNDGSPDQSAEILREYESDDRVTVYTQENQGFSGARNTGLKSISAKYLSFVDSDDEIPQGAIEALLDAAFANDADIVQGSADTRFLDGKTRREYYHPLNTNAPKSSIRGFAWGKVYKPEVFKNICFPNKYWYEDTIISMLIAPSAKHIVTIPNLVYYYTINPKSITHTQNGNPKTIDSFYVTRSLLADQERIMQNDPSFDYPFEKIFTQIANNWHRTFSLGLVIESAIFILTCEMLNKRFPSPLPLNPKYKELYNSLINKDFYTYRRECAFLI